MQAQQALQKQTRTDALTGLPNRGEALAALQRILDADRPAVAVLYLDLDNFKDINDAHGHAAGDRALDVAARRVRESIGEAAVAARIGGDEFLVLLPQMRARDVIEIAERIRSAVSRPLDPVSGPVATVSIGIAEAVPCDDVDALIARADKAMYRAKQAGRDRVNT